MRKKRIAVNDLMQEDYVYILLGPVGKNFHPVFTPEKMGVLGGKILDESYKLRLDPMASRADSVG